MSLFAQLFCGHVYDVVERIVMPSSLEVKQRTGTHLPISPEPWESKTRLVLISRCRVCGKTKTEKFSN